MSLLKLLVSLIVCFTMNTAMSKESKPKPKPTPLFSLESLYGDAKVNISIYSQKKKYQIVLNHHERGVLSKEISKKDVRYLVQSFQKIKTPTNNIGFCKRNHQILKYKNKEILGCIGRKNKTAKDVSMIANLMSLYF